MPYRSTAQKAATIRQTLKSELGLNSRQVSVRCGSGGGSIRVEILAPVGDKFPQIERIANAQESIRYDERSGEILSGGNTYVSVSFASAIVEAEARTFYAWLDAIPVTAKGEREYIHDSGVRDEYSKIFVGRTENGFTWKGMTWHRDQIARSIATYKLVAGPADSEDGDEPVEEIAPEPVAVAEAVETFAAEAKEFAADFEGVRPVDPETLRRMWEAGDDKAVEILAAWIREQDCREECESLRFSTVPADAEELAILGIRAALATGWSGIAAGSAERFH